MRVHGPQRLPARVGIRLTNCNAQIDVIFTGNGSSTRALTAIRLGELDELRAHRRELPSSATTFQLTDNVYEAAGVTTADATGTVFPVVGRRILPDAAPAPAGQHEIKFGGTVNGNSLDLTYQVTVTSKGSIQPVVTVP